MLYILEQFLIVGPVLLQPVKVEKKEGGDDQGLTRVDSAALGPH